jgi:curli biogenesis system outer membrane secretion channel CsgG
MSKAEEYLVLASFDIVPKFLKVSLVFGIILGNSLFARDTLNIAILDLRGNLASDYLAVLSEHFVNAFVNQIQHSGNVSSYVNVLERRQIQEILREQVFTLSGAVSEDTENTATKIGNLLGVNKLIFGNVNSVGNLYSYNIRMVDVQSGRIEYATTKTCSDSYEPQLLVVKLNQAIQSMLGAIRLKTLQRPT